jgi:hypothetical protein
MKKLDIRTKDGIIVCSVIEQNLIADILLGAKGVWQSGKYENGVLNYLLVQAPFTFTNAGFKCYVWEDYKIFIVEN